MPVPHKFYNEQDLCECLIQNFNIFTILSCIHTNRSINCCSDVSTIVFFDQSSVFFYILQWASIKYHRTLDEKIPACPCIVLNRQVIEKMTKTKITPHAKHPGRTQQFIDAIQEALDTFEDEISSLTDDIRGKVYKKYVEAYHDALIPVWNLGHFASVDTVMKTITDKDLREITVMAECLKPTPPRMKVSKEKTKVPDLKTVMNTLIKKFPGQSLPDTSTCEKIGNLFAQLSAAHKVYSEAAEGLTELSTLMMPEQFTMLLTATMTPAIQLIVPGLLMSPLSTPSPQQPSVSTAVGRSEIMNFTKLRVLPDPDSNTLMSCDKNSATRVLTAAIYCQLEHNYFDETCSRVDIVTAFRCNTSQLSKAVTGIDYKSGPHHYKPKKASKRATDSSDTDPPKPKAPCTEDPTTSGLKESVLPDIPEEDMLSSSSDSSTLPPGLF